jgi:hypothetical protein
VHEQAPVLEQALHHEAAFVDETPRELELGLVR